MKATRLKLTLQALAGSVWKRMLGRHVRAIVVETEHGLFAADPEDFGIARRLRYQGASHDVELGRLSAHIDPNTDVLVVGAHIGTLAVPLARTCRSVVAVEANPRTFELLEMNIALNGARNCEPLHLAASDRREELPFLLSRANSGGSKRAPRVRSFLYDYDRPDTVSVPAAPLDEELGGRSFDVIVMDIEGSETFALRGMQRLLAGARVLAVEFVPHHLRNVAGVSVGEFLAPVEAHFDLLHVPSKGVTVGPEAFLTLLEEMYEAGEEDDGIVFERTT